MEKEITNTIPLLSFSDIKWQPIPIGWICPVCGRGNAPDTPFCNCNSTSQLAHTSSPFPAINMETEIVIIDKDLEEIFKYCG